MAGQIGEGSVAVVTGGASGIGEQIVRQLCDRGAAVVFGDVNEDAGEAIAADTGARFLRMDVRLEADHAALVAAAEADHGGLDHAFYNAGVSGVPIEQHFDGTPFDPADGDADRYRWMMQVNVDGVVLGVAAALPALRRRGQGGIVATASVAGLLPYSPDPWYAASKHAVVGYVRSVAHNLRAEHITVNAICPGGVETNMTGASAADNPEMILPASAVAAAQLDAATTTDTGRCYSIVARHGVQEHRFTVVDGF